MKNDMPSMITMEQPYFIRPNRLKPTPNCLKPLPSIVIPNLDKSEIFHL